MGPAAGDPRGPDPHRVEAAARLAGHFMATIGGNRRDPFFHAAGEQVLTGTLLAAALGPHRLLAEVVAWLQHGRRDAIAALDNAGADTEAADLEATLSGADVTTKGIFQTARTATKALTSERILRWITPPDTWREPGPDLPELDPWTVLDHTPATLHLLSKEGAGTAAPVVAALVDRILEIAELTAQARGGRLDPPVVAVLDEAANICPIRELPQLYSHYGSRGIQVITMLQSYQQGVGVWGDQGMDALWSAATIKLVGAGVDDHTFLARLSGLIGDHDVPQLAISHARGQGPSRQYSTARRPVLPSPTCARCPRPRPCCCHRTPRRARRPVPLVPRTRRRRHHPPLRRRADRAPRHRRLHPPHDPRRTPVSTDPTPPTTWPACSPTCGPRRSPRRLASPPERPPRRTPQQPPRPRRPDPADELDGSEHRRHGHRRRRSRRTRCRPATRDPRDRRLRAHRVGARHRRRRHRPPATRRVRLVPAVVGTPRSRVPVRSPPPRLDRTRPRTRRRHVDLDPRPPRPLPARTAQPPGPSPTAPTPNATAAAPTPPAATDPAHHHATMTGRTTLLGSAAVAVLAAPLLLVGLLLTITTTT